MNQQDQAIRAYHQRGRRKLIAISALLLVAFVSFVVATVVGPINLSASQLLDALLHPNTAPEQASVVLWDLRLPASVMALLIGASLGLAGGMMQTILDNPLAEPFTLGISAAAAFGS